MKKGPLIKESQVLPLMNVGVISSAQIADGKMVPVLVVDTSSNPEVQRYFKFHQTSGAGDVTTAWCRLANRKDFLLHFEVTNPTDLVFGVLFRMPDDAMSVDLISRIQVVHLQSSSPEQGKSVNFDADSVSMGIGAEIDSFDWERRLHRMVTRKFRKLSVPRKEAKKMAKEHIAEMRKIGSFRMI